jgi:mannitol-1-/sugar-/sorbitol-6-phosphatase
MAEKDALADVTRPRTHTVTVTVDGVLFDLDGVLVDTKEDVLAHWRTFAGWYGLNADQLVERVHGQRHSDVIRREIAHLGEAEINAATTRYEELECKDTAGTREVPGARALMTAMPNERWAIVTSCTAPLVRARLSAVRLDVPQRVVSADQVTQGKPHPEGYVAGAALLGFEPGRCAVFEDAPSGLQAAVAAGSVPIAVATTVPVEDLLASMPGGGLVVADLDAVRVRTVNGRLLLQLEDLGGHFRRAGVRK